MIAPLPPPRGDRPASRSPGAAGGPGADDQGAIAAQHAAFDLRTAETAELEREHEALETLMLAQLKNEDEIMKKWIALI